MDLAVTHGTASRILSHLHKCERVVVGLNCAIQVSIINYAYNVMNQAYVSLVALLTVSNAHRVVKVLLPNTTTYFSCRRIT